MKTNQVCNNRVANNYHGVKKDFKVKYTNVMFIGNAIELTF